MQPTDVHISVDLREEVDVRLLTEQVRQSCMDNLFDRIDTEQMVLACSEIGHNALRHGGGGVADIEELKEGKIIRVTVSDQGPGIHNIELASREGYSTVKTSLGLGIEAAQRLVDQFVIRSKPGYGTTVILEQHRPIAGDVIDYGLVSIPDNNYNYNGDQYVLKEYDGDSLLLGVIDGPGQGYDAHSIAQTCKQFVESNYRKSIPHLLSALNMLMKESNDETGITCSLARIQPGTISYGGLGDTHAYLQIDSGVPIALTNQDGRAGYVKTMKVPLSEHKFSTLATIIICSDGIKNMDTETTFSADAQSIANSLFDKYHRVSGDATVIVGKYNL